MDKDSKKYRLKQSAEYTEENWWDWAVWIEAKGQALQDIEKVVYTLHPTFRQPVRTVTDATTQFRLEEQGWGSFTLYAKVFLKNKEEIPLEIDLLLEYPENPVVFKDKRIAIPAPQSQLQGSGKPGPEPIPGTAAPAAQKGKRKTAIYLGMLALIVVAGYIGFSVLERSDDYSGGEMTTSAPVTTAPDDPVEDSAMAYDSAMPPLNEDYATATPDNTGIGEAVERPGPANTGAVPGPNRRPAGTGMNKDLADFSGREDSLALANILRSHGLSDEEIKRIVRSAKRELKGWGKR